VIIGLYGLSVAAFVVLARLSRRADRAVPAPAALLDAVLSWRVGRVPVGRIAVLAIWWWLGWHLFAR
jgi:hypothetical protein